VSVKTKIFHSELQRIIAEPGELRLKGSTVGECLADLVRRYPAVEPVIFDGQGRLRRQFYVYVNHESMFKADFSQPVTENDILILVVLASGG
jgi:hypothetical protein